jgi:hypothetical protein
MRSAPKLQGSTFLTAGLKLRQNQERRHERVRDVRREVHLQAVQPEAPSGDHTEEQVESIQRGASDEDAKADGRGFPRWSTTFRSQLPRDPTQARRHADAQLNLQPA